MRAHRSVLVAVVLFVGACSPKAKLVEAPDPNPDPNPTPCPEPCKEPPDAGHPAIPGSSPGSEVAESEILREMSHWLEMFRDRQRVYHAHNLRFAREVTIGGKITPLPSPFKTEYSAHQTQRNYAITVRHPPTTSRCYLQDGEFVPGKPVDNAGRIICGRY